MAYSNLIRYGVVLPDAVPRVLVGCFHPTALVAEVEVWRKLIRSFDPELSFKVLLFGNWSLSELERALPTSLLTQLEVKSDVGWVELIGPDKLTRSFALVSEAHQARILVLGIPTEETWEEFQGYL